MASPSATQVARILYKEMVEGDARKLVAESNDAATGGGARDLRFGSLKRVWPIVLLMFPQTEQVTRKRGGKSVQLTVQKGEFCWRESDGSVARMDSYFEPPTDARPSEGRIRQIHSFPCLDISLLPMVGVGNRVLLLLVQLHDGSVWPYYVEETTLRIPGKWDPRVAKDLLACLAAERPKGRAMLGFRDFTTQLSYCNGK